MFNFDDPGFIIAVLAILVGLRFAFYVVEHLTARTTVPEVADGPALAPDEVVEDAPLPLGVPAMPDAPAPQPEPDEPKENEGSPVRVYLELLDSAIIAVVLVFFLIRPFLLSAFFIPSGSMIPTLQENDKLLATKFTYHLREPAREDVVVFRAPKDALVMMNEKYDPDRPTDYVKRVIGVPGDRIRIVADQGIFINGTHVREPASRAVPDYNFPLTPYGDLNIDPRVRNKLLPHIHGEELVVPQGYLFVMGDNRNSSHDSHVWGLLPRKALVGKAVVIFWPLARAGIIR